MLTVTIASFLQGLLATLFVVFCLLLCLFILIQKPRGGGLSGAFGGAGGGSQMFGGKSGDILTWITVSFFVGFLVVGMALVVVTRNEARSRQGVEVDESLTVPPDGGALLPTDLGDTPAKNEPPALPAGPAAETPTGAPAPPAAPTGAPAPAPTPPAPTGNPSPPPTSEPANPPR